MKFNPFGTAWKTMSSQEIAECESIVATVREAVGPEIDLLLEAKRFSFFVGQEMAYRLYPEG